MGIQVHAIKLIDKTLKKFTIPNDEVQIVDWGNSYIKPSTQHWILDDKNKNCVLNHSHSTPNYKIRTAKDHTNAWVSGDFFKAFKYKYNAIDLNGKEESYEIDLREDITKYPIPNSDEYSILEGIINYANLIIDCGTSEHVDNQYYNFKNAYNILKIGGYIVHCLPKKGYWKGHCKYKYEKDFFKQLGKLCNYKIIELFEYKESKYRTDICCVFKKQQNSKFPTIKKFLKLPIYIEEGEEFNDRNLYGYAYNTGSLTIFRSKCSNVNCTYRFDCQLMKKKKIIYDFIKQINNSIKHWEKIKGEDIRKITLDKRQCPQCNAEVMISFPKKEWPNIIERIKKFERYNDWVL